MLQVCTVRHIAARRMSPSAMFLRTPAAAHDARRSGYKTPSNKAQSSAELRPRSRNIKYRENSWVLGEVGTPRWYVGSHSPHSENSTMATVTLAG